MSAKIIIRRGEDRVVPIDVVRKSPTNVKRPFDLTGWTKIKVGFKKADNTLLEVDTTISNGRQATTTYEGVIYTAVNNGVLGNSIELVFDGIRDIATVVSEWNVANPLNQVSSDAVDDTVVPTAATISLDGGLDDFPKVEVVSEIQGKIKITLDNVDTNSLKIGPGQGVVVTIDFGDHDLGNRRIATAKNIISVEKSTL